MRYATLITSPSGTSYLTPVVVSGGVLVVFKEDPAVHREAVSRLLGCFTSVRAYEHAVANPVPLSPSNGWTHEACGVFNRAVRVTLSEAQLVDAELVEDDLDAVPVVGVRSTSWRNTTPEQRADVVARVMRSGLTVHAWHRANPDGPGRSTLYRWVEELAGRATGVSYLRVVN